MEERIESGGSEPFADLADPAAVSNLLVHAPAMDSGSTEACFDLLSATPPASTAVLAVTYTRPPAEWIAAWDHYVGVDPARGAVVSVGRSPASVEDPAWRVTTLENARDLTTVGVALTEAMAELTDDDGDAADGRLALCFDSVTALLQYANLQTAVRFLHTVMGRVDDAGGLGHYHVDPDAHGARDLAALAGLVDAIAAVDDGTLEIRR